MFNNRRKEMILVALDHSPTSLSAAKMAIQIAKSRNLIIYGLLIIVISVYQPFGVIGIAKRFRKKESA